MTTVSSQPNKGRLLQTIRTKKNLFSKQQCDICKNIVVSLYFKLWIKLILITSGLSRQLTSRGKRQKKKKFHITFSLKFTASVIFNSFGWYADKKKDEERERNSLDTYIYLCLQWCPGKDWEFKKKNYQANGNRYLGYSFMVLICKSKNIF